MLSKACRKWSSVTGIEWMRLLLICSSIWKSPRSISIWLLLFKLFEREKEWSKHWLVPVWNRIFSVNYILSCRVFLTQIRFKFQASIRWNRQIWQVVRSVRCDRIEQGHTVWRHRQGRWLGLKSSIFWPLLRNWWICRNGADKFEFLWYWRGDNHIHPPQPPRILLTLFQEPALDATFMYQYPDLPEWLHQSTPGIPHHPKFKGIAVVAVGFGPLLRHRLD